MAVSEASFLRKYNVLIASAIFFVPVFFIAYRAEWQYDEAWTYLGILHSSAKDIAEYKQFRLANNHVLNSLYFHLLQGWGIKTELMYRLVSLLSFALHYLYLYKLLKQNGYKAGNMSYLVFFLMPYMWFFSLGRGYAPALAAFTAAWYYYRSFEISKNERALLFFVLAGCVASLSLFSFVFPFVAMLLLLVVQNLSYLLKPRRILILLPVIPVMAYVFFMGRTVNRFDEYIVGGNSLFSNGALSSIISYLSLSDMVAAKIFLALKIAVCASLLPAAIVLVKRKVLYTEHLVMLMTIILMVLSHVLFGSKYPMFRGLMYMVLLMYLPFVYSNARANIFVSAHLVVLMAIGSYNIGMLVDRSMKHKSYDVLAYMAGRKQILFVDNVNPNIVLYNHLYFGDSIKLVQYEMEEPLVEKSFYRALDTAVYVVGTAAELKRKGVASLFDKQYELPETMFFVKK